MGRSQVVEGGKAMTIEELAERTLAVMEGTSYP